MRLAVATIAVGLLGGCSANAPAGGASAGAGVVGTVAGMPAVVGAGGTSGRSAAAAGSGIGGLAGRAAGGSVAPSASGVGGAGGASGVAGVSAAGGGGAAGQAPVPPGVSALLPAADSQNNCADPSLRLTFAGPPSFGTTGKFQVWSAGPTPRAVASVDVSSASASETIGGTVFQLTRATYVEGNTAVIRLPARALSYGQTYYVTIDAGALKGPTGSAFAISDTMLWRFSTAAAAPSDRSALRVAQDGSGAFCSVQGALDALPARNDNASVITIGPGTYQEIVHLVSKNNITLHGQDRKTTIIAGTNNENMNPGTATRALVGIDASSGIVIENLTIHNVTTQGGSQAEALRMQTCERCIVRDADILSLQDTLLWSGHIYATNCYIAGNVDFIWGTGAIYIEKSEIKTVGRSGYNVQARNGPTGYGYVFVDCKLTSDAGVTGSTLGRIDVSAYPGSHVAYIDCQMGNHITAAGWTITGGIATSALRFWEYQSLDLAGQPLNVSGRIAGSSQISATDAAMMRDPKTVLGGWQPPQ